MIRVILLGVVLSVLCVGSAWGAARQDVSFGVGGIAVQEGGGAGSPRDLALDGKGRLIVAAGTVSEDCSVSYVARFSADGGQDHGFGGEGFATPGKDCEILSSVTALPDGGILAAGFNQCPSDLLLDCYLVSYKMHHDGTAASDWGFSAIKGRRIVRNGNPGKGASSLIPLDVARDSAGKFLIGGTADHGHERSGAFVIRMRSDGSLDKGFRGTELNQARVPGMVEIPPPPGSEATVEQVRSLPGSQILASGSYRGKLMVMKLLRNGKPDPRFAVRGKFVRDLDGHGDCECTRGYALARDQRGRILLGGAKGPFFANGSSGRFSSFIVRLLPDGKLDTSFGRRGVVFPAWSKSSIRSIVVQRDGRIVASGQLGPRSFVARFKTSGQLDSSFFNRGLIRYPRSNEADLLKLDRKGRIIVGGRSLYSGIQLRRIIPR